MKAIFLTKKGNAHQAFEMRDAEKPKVILKHHQSQIELIWESLKDY